MRRPMTLHRAAQVGDITRVEDLFQQARIAYANHKDRFGNTALHFALEAGLFGTTRRIPGAVVPDSDLLGLETEMGSAPISP